MTTKIELEHVKQIYQDIANEFDVTRAYKWRWISNFINSLPKNSLIYDIGCGSGRNMDYPDYRFIGFDNCQSFINICINNIQCKCLDYSKHRSLNNIDIKGNGKRLKF